MDTQKKDILCQLHEIGVLLCKLNDERKLRHCEKKVKDLHSYLKKGKSKSKSKSIKKKTMRKSKPGLDYDMYKPFSEIDKPSESYASTPMITDRDISIDQPVKYDSNPSVNSSSISDPTSASSDDNYTEKPSVSKTLPPQPYISNKMPLNL